MKFNIDEIAKTIGLSKKSKVEVPDDFVAKTKAKVAAMTDEEIKERAGSSVDVDEARKIIYETLVKQEMIKRSGGSA